jgi:rhodanese-related sulfurtransferase
MIDMASSWQPQPGCAEDAGHKHAGSPTATVSITTRDQPPAVDALLERARARIARVEPEDLAGVTEGGGLIVDIRPEFQRRRDGEMPEAVVIDRNVLEWRLDPTSPFRIPEVRGHEQLVVLVCDEGYASSLAAASLQDLGLRNATDLVGGYQAWLQRR